MWWGRDVKECITMYDGYDKVGWGRMKSSVIYHNLCSTLNCSYWIVQPSYLITRDPSLLCLTLDCSAILPHPSTTFFVEGMIR